MSKEHLNTLLIESTLSNDIDSVKYALDKGADINTRKKTPHQGVHYEETALLLATENKFEDIVKLLIEKKADVNAQSPVTGTSALHMAAHQGFNNIAKLLLDAGANRKLENSNKMTPAQIAFDRGTKEARETGNTIDTYKKIQSLQDTKVKKVKSAKTLKHATVLPQLQPVIKSNSYISFDKQVAMGTAIFLIGSILAWEGEDFAKDKTRLAGKCVMGLLFCLLILASTREAMKMKKSTAEMIVAIRTRAGLLSDAFTEMVINGADVAKALEKATKTTDEVIQLLGKSTDKAIVQLKDELSGSLVQLRGDSSRVAKAIQDGISTNKFKIDAPVNAVINANVDVDVNNTASFSIF